MKLMLRQKQLKTKNNKKQKPKKIKNMETKKLKKDCIKYFKKL